MAAYSQRVSLTTRNGYDTEGAYAADTLLAGVFQDPGDQPDTLAVTYDLAGINQGATCTAWTWTLSPTNVTGTNHSLKAYGQKVPNATVPSSGNLPSGMSPATTAQTTYGPTTPVGLIVLDVTAIIQELVNQGTWAAGNLVNLIFTNNGMTGAPDREVQFSSAGGDPTNAPILAGTYVNGAPSTIAERRTSSPLGARAGSRQAA